MKKTNKKSKQPTVLIAVGITVGIIAFFGILFYCLTWRVKQTSQDVTTYQFDELILLYISSCVTTLAVIVALLKDEIKLIWLKPKLEISPKFQDFLNEKTSVIAPESPDIRAEYYYSILNVKNIGNVHITSCTIAITELQYSRNEANKSYIDVSVSDDLRWTGKNQTPPIHQNGGSAEIFILQIKINDAGTTSGSQSEPAKLFIGGIDATLGHPALPGSKWIATFNFYFDKSQPVEYKLEIAWDGEWHNRLTEMLQHINIKAL